MSLVVVISIFQVMVVGTGAVEDAYCGLYSTSLISLSSLNCVVELVFERSSEVYLSADIGILLVIDTCGYDSNIQRTPLTYPCYKLLLLQGGIKDGITPFPCIIFINSLKIDGIFNSNRSICFRCVTEGRGTPNGEADSACCIIILNGAKFQCLLNPVHFCPSVFFALLTTTIVLAVISTFIAVTIRYLKVPVVIRRNVKEIKSILNNESSLDKGETKDDISIERDRNRERGISLSLKLNDSYTYEMEKNSFFINKNKFLGKGQCGEVYGGSIDKFKGNVAFKSSKEQWSLCQMKSLVSEFKILCSIGYHENIVSLLGAYTKEIENGIFYMALECCLDSLESYLRKNRKEFCKNHVNSFETKKNISLPIQPSRQGDNPFDTMKILCKWSSEIANGMEFLENKKVIHLDLAARNILLNGDCTCLWKTVAKIADFGLSRQLDGCTTEYNKTENEALPWRWLALESLQSSIYSSKTDVWSFGITLWEIFSLGDIPYPGQTSWSKDFIEELENGLRNGKPPFASEKIYEIMMKCWLADPKQRPKFLRLKQFFQDQNQTNYTIKYQEKNRHRPWDSDLQVNPYVTKDEFDTLMSET